MAKKKTDNMAEETAPVVENPEVNEQLNPVPEEAAPEVSESSEESEAESQPETKNAPAEIPAKALAYLKRHPEDKEAYIDRYGGVFASNTPKVFIKDAVLYQNPYFKQ